MGWTNSHLHQFAIDGARYAEPDGFMDRIINHKNIKLAGVLGDQIRELMYEYDFGDGWSHRVVVEQMREGHPAWSGSLCTAGERACPPEDVGGPWGYVEFLSAMADPAHEGHLDVLTWIGGVFDPEGFDINAANDRIRRLKG
ncbi:plasmid pRiA4b ORF-3 family protein [Herbaspirillum sp. alder98]|uniref:plasmid pRiA4b ORF-3 family protein n=1 Tax=Herbaspirillum sp. alder98 TaxID=2913096 RepID=UPI002234F479|nr:plasmid pRiA4b ORF-3 family protein [Herbaspirillum sp. alder98]